jgi:glutamate racemase
MIGTGTTSKFLTTGDAARVSSRATQFLKRQITFEKA